MRTILLADDEAHLRTLVRTTLEDPGTRVVEVASGTAALELAQRERPDLVVLDLMMPGLSGLDVLRRLRAESGTASIPVVMLTATGQEEDRQRALRFGADAYLVKPFSPLELLQTVEELRLRSRELRERVSGTDKRGVVATAGGGADPARQVAEPLSVPESQLALYVRDLKQAVEAERAKAEQLATANARLLLLDRLKSEFLSFISHELRTPLNALSAVDLFDPEADPAEQREIVELMREGYQRLDEFVRRGLEYFDRLAAGRRVSEVCTDLPALARRLASELRREGAEVELVLPISECRVRMPAEDLERVLRILLGNAVKFSRAMPWIRLEVAHDAAQAILRVADRGAGFSPELVEEIFRPFTVTDPLHHSQGSGISLALARAILESAGGRIRARSEGPGTGALFEAELPL